MGIVAVALLLWATASQLRSYRQGHQELEAAWAEARPTGPGAPRRAPQLEREPDLFAARLAISRALLAASLDAGGLAELPPEEAAEEAARIDRRLERARADAANVLAQRPAAWEAPLILGGVAFLQRWREGSLHRHREEWERPLLQARALAPAHREPKGLLAAGRLAIWHTLNQPDRDATRELLRDAFTDPALLRRLLPLWAESAADRDDLASVLPSAPLPWKLLEEHHTRRSEWEDACAARDRWRDFHLSRLAEDLAEAERRLDGGDLVGGRNLLLQVATAAPPSRQAAALFATALERLPPGLVSPARQRALRGWLDWALPLWMMEQPSLPPEAYRRLGGLISGLPTEIAALTALAGGELARGERMERASGRQWSPEWAPYMIAKARLLDQRGEIEEAREALRQAHRRAHDLWAYQRLAARLEPPGGAAGEPGSEARDRELPLAAATWHGLQWQVDDRQHRLEVVPAYPAVGLAIAFTDAPARGGAVEVSWNGEIQGCQAVASDETVRLGLAGEGEPGLLQVRVVAGGRLRPGTVALEGAAGS